MKNHIRYILTLSALAIGLSFSQPAQTYADTTQTNTTATSETQTSGDSATTTTTTGTTTTTPATTTVKKVKPHWSSSRYVTEDGSYATGSWLIKKTYYIFGKDGKLAKSDGVHLVTVNDKYYLANKNGTAYHGWYVIKGKLYYAGTSGKCKKNMTFKGYTFGNNAAVTKTSTAHVKAKIAAVKLYNKITKPSMSKSEKLKACWNYVTSHRFSYAMKYPNLKKKNWQQSTALNMIKTRKGNCYSFACIFAALAKECGYKPYVVCGRVSGSRDHASDGMTRHSWVRINGLNYDPEGQYAGWYRGCYGSSYYRIRHSVQKLVIYDAEK